MPKPKVPRPVLEAALWVFLALALIAGSISLSTYVSRREDARKLERQSQRLITQTRIARDSAADQEAAPTPSVTASPVSITILPEYQTLYAENSDLIGWLRISDTVIDYPVMQTPEDEEYYIDRGFDRRPNSNGCLIMDTDSVVGVGTAAQQYQGGEAPSTNLIIHGHTMQSGAMFGKLQLYADQEYAAAHRIIQFDSLYEHREYELISAFYSQVYYPYENVFKFYYFFNAETQEEFDDWYSNIKSLALYDTGVTAEFGDSFITLSCCSYQVEDGRFVVVGKRIQ